jgi:peptidoglycan/xylan/chitin deacetylase (PgdA/CDA1 family)
VAHLQAEIVQCADELEQHAGTPVRYFCYPDGRYCSQAVELVRQRFDAAFTIESRYRAPDIWRFPRRSADAGADLRQVLSPWFPLRRRLIDAGKRALRF